MHYSIIFIFITFIVTIIIFIAHNQSLSRCMENRLNCQLCSFLYWDTDVVVEVSSPCFFVFCCCFFFTLYKEIQLSCTSGQTNPSPEKDHKLNTICKFIIITSFFLFTQIFYTRNDFWICGVTTPSLFWTKEESCLRTSYLCLNFYCSSSSPIRKPV